MKFVEFNFDLIINSFPLLLLGAGVTVKITLMSVAVGVVIGLFVGIARISSFRLLRFLAAVYVDFFRGTPLLVQIFLIYFAIPVITGQRMDPFVAAISACGITSRSGMSWLNATSTAHRMRASRTRCPTP